MAKQTENDPEFHLVVAWNSTEPESPPQVISSFGDNFTPVVGKIIGQWSILEQELDLLISALLQARQAPAQGWQRGTFTKRFTLLQKEWKTFIAGSPGLSKEMADIVLEIERAKVVRDGICHKRILFGLGQSGPWIRFQNENSRVLWSQKYLQADFQTALLRIISACGKIFRLMHLEFAKHFSEADILLLKGLPETDSSRFPKRTSAPGRPTGA